MKVVVVLAVAGVTVAGMAVGKAAVAV